MPSVSRDRRTQWQQQQKHLAFIAFPLEIMMMMMMNPQQNSVSFASCSQCFSLLLLVASSGINHHTIHKSLFFFFSFSSYSFIRLHQPTLIERERERGNQNRADLSSFRVFFIASRGEQNNVASFKMMIKTFRSRAHSSSVPSRNRPDYTWNKRIRNVNFLVVFFFVLLKANCCSKQSLMSPSFKLFSRKWYLHPKRIWEISF